MVASALLTLTACGGSDISPATYDAPADAGSAALAGEGTVDLDGGCVVVEAEGGKRMLLAWPDDRVAVEDGSIRFENETSEVVVSDGDTVTIGGTTLGSAEDEAEGGAVEVDWVEEPDDSCEYDELVGVESVTKDG
ncbi:hypothetical protein L0U85_02940 [Glycomyces sp. L485]|uniref:hypothetical protein n=1 Tax=Glycomyces sp. L485 TaxID=2909235 RepID=UPI001F4AE61C|nr:hypothetical protein [Glycomyces sp. L485]MCH7229820.1 hypothetical protein [Glycomyces sp. L485]